MSTYKPMPLDAVDRQALMKDIWSYHINPAATQDELYFWVSVRAPNYLDLLEKS